jgi:hypothetical protein
MTAEHTGDDGEGPDVCFVSMVKSMVDGPSTLTDENKLLRRWL